MIVLITFRKVKVQYMCSAVKSLTRVEEISKMTEVRVPTGFAFAADPDLDLEKLGPHEMKSAYRISKT